MFHHLQLKAQEREMLTRLRSVNGVWETFFQDNWASWYRSEFMAVTTVTVHHTL